MHRWIFSKFSFTLVRHGELSMKAQNVQEDSICMGLQGNTSKQDITCVCLYAMADDTKPRIIGIE